MKPEQIRDLTTLDWDHLSDEQKMENLKHLNKHFSSYRCSDFKNGVYEIGINDGVRVLDWGSVLIDLRKCRFDEVCINQAVFSKYKNEELWKEAMKLREKCVIKDPAFVKQTKVMNALGFTMHYVVKPVVLIGSLAGAFWFGYHLGDKLIGKYSQKQTEKIKEIVKEYDQEKAKSDAVNIDSLINQHVR